MSLDVLEKFKLEERVAIVTGSAKGLGKAAAAALSSVGATVVITSRDVAQAEEAAEELSQQTGGQTLGLALDLRESDSIAPLTKTVEERFGSIDILVNNAGLTHRGAIDELSTEQWDEVLDTNLRGAWLCCQAVLPMMRAGKWGRIINISSMFDKVALANRSPYIASKGGLTALTRALAIEAAPDNITVNAISPGPFQTEMHDAKARQGMVSAIPLGRFGDPAELGPAVVFLASNASSFITGISLSIDGGYTVR